MKLRNAFFLLLFVSCASTLMAQPAVKVKSPVSSKEIARPKLVVGLMVDQMRWDFLYRYYDRYSNDGFKRMLREGFTCENAHIPYAQSVTAPGHATVYSGSVPSIHGIVGNEWFDVSLNRNVYCVEDDRVKTIGGSATADPMSPRNYNVTNISDQLRLSTNFRSKVVGVAIKDRGAILPAGHTGDAYWYDSRSGNFVTSTHYYNELPAWVAKFNNNKIADSLYAKDWNTLYPIETYVQSDKDNVGYEGRFMHEKEPVFPHDLKSQIGVNYGTISSTPYGNTLTLEFAKAALKAESLGKDAVTDLLAISLSSPDYAGHQFGPNSIEIEDMYLRLDQELAIFFKYLDKEVGQGQWLFFLTADHGAAHVPGYLSKNKIPVSTINININGLNTKIAGQFKVPKAIKAFSNYHMYLDNEALDSAKQDKEALTAYIIKEIQRDTAVWMAFETKELQETNMPEEVREKFAKGIHPKLSGDIIVVLKSGYFGGGRTGTTHGSWYPYDAHIPMVFMGWGVKHGYTNRRTWMTDIAPTIAAMLKIESPNGAIGLAVPEITDVQ